MKTILIVHDDKKFHRLIIDGLKAYGSVTTRRTKDLIVKSASNGKKAANILKRFKVDLVVTDIEGPATDRFELIAYMKKAGYRDIPVIVMTASSSPEIKNKLEQMDVLHCLKKPFVLLELLEKILDVLDKTSKALISDFDVPNFLQAIKMEKKTCTLEITSEGKVGYLHLEDGDLIDAKANELTGDDAAIEILGWKNTELKIEELSSYKKRIHTSIMHILMEAAKARDERAGVASRSESLFDEIVTLAEGLHYKQAQEKLTRFLKANPNSHKGWLWHSRITGKITSIEKSLNNARQIAPNDPEIVEEIDKVELAKGVLARGQISHCPFCWAPLNLKVIECPYCRAHLFIHEELLVCTKAANRQILQQAIERYTRVVTRETNPAAHYYLGIAHLNLGQWEKGLDQLNKTVETFPEKKFYADQLQVLMNLLTSSEAIFAQETVVKEKGSDLGPATVEETEKKRILVVESSPTIRKAISIALSKRGYEVIEAGDGLEALNRLDKTRPDLILMDIVLPKLDSYKILSIVRDNSELTDIPVIMLTSKEGLVSRVKRKLTGSTAFLPKPFDLSKLLEATEKYLL